MSLTTSSGTLAVFASTMLWKLVQCKTQISSEGAGQAFGFAPGPERAQELLASPFLIFMLSVRLCPSVSTESVTIDHIRLNRLLLQGLLGIIPFQDIITKTSATWLMDHRHPVEKPEQIAIALEELSCRFKARDTFGLFDPLAISNENSYERLCQRVQGEPMAAPFAPPCFAALVGCERTPSVLEPLAAANCGPNNGTAHPRSKHRQLSRSRPSAIDPSSSAATPLFH
ncbi:hypothetical protein LA080_006178 [Diaporthe eres]|nr:hypothetical protein LA080_006178 [Diaporthe eres]